MKTVLILALLLISFTLPAAWSQEKLPQNILAISDVLKGLPETYFPMFIANGVTGVRDVAADLEFLKQLQKDISEGRVVGPRMNAERAASKD